MPLTDTVIRKAKPTERAFKLFDGHGLFLLVKPNGGKYWRLQYRNSGKQKLLALGCLPGRDTSRSQGQAGQGTQADRQRRGSNGCQARVIAPSKGAVRELF